MMNDGHPPAWWWLICVLSALLVVLMVIVFWGYHADKALMFIGFFIAFSLVFILLDVVMFEIKRKQTQTTMGQAQKQDSDGAKIYYPNPQIWGIGLVLGAGIAVLYLFCTATMILLAKSPTNDLALNLTLILVPAILLGFIVWAIVKICRSE